jgi:class 3 adenylate cyclase
MVDENNTAEEMCCTEVWIAPSLQQSMPHGLLTKNVCLTFTPSVNLSKWVRAEDEPLWLSDIMQHSDFSSSSLVNTANLHTAFGFAIQTDKQVLGVMLFFNQNVLRRDDDLLQIVATLGNQLGQYIQRKRAENALQLEREKTERLLLNILPQPIAKRLKQETCTIAEQFSEVSVLFADLVGFTEMASTLSPIELVGLLNEIFSEFDKLTGEYGLEKIKTIGDAYMVVSGLPEPNDKHAFMIADMALDMQKAMVLFNKKNQRNLSIRIGIHCGPVVAGVIGLKKFIYDLWGDTVNTASRMESHGLADCIQVSSTLYELLKMQYHFEKRGVISIKGKGSMTTYLLVGKLSSTKSMLA